MSGELDSNQQVYRSSMCMFDLMRAAHDDKGALAALNEGLLGNTYTCMAFGCDVMKSMQGGSPITYSICIQGNKIASPPLSKEYLFDVIPLDNDGTSFD